MLDQNNVWYYLGYALERARERLPRADRLRALEERQGDRRVGAARRSRPGQWPPHRNSPTGEPWEAVLAVAATALLGRALGTMSRKRKPEVVRLLRAGAAGVGAALLRELFRSLGPGERPRPPLVQLVQDAALTGTTRGLVYGALVEPLLHGPPVIRGTAYGSLEYVVSPWGGLTRLVGAHAPHRKVPFLADLLDDLGPSDDTLIDHVLFGVALALLYGAGPAITD